MGANWAKLNKIADNSRRLAEIGANSGQFKTNEHNWRQMQTTEEK